MVTWNKKERSIWCKWKTSKEWPHTVIVEHSVLLHLQTQMWNSEHVLKACLSLQNKSLILKEYYVRRKCKFKPWQVNYRKQGQAWTHTWTHRVTDSKRMCAHAHTPNDVQSIASNLLCKFLAWVETPTDNHLTHKWKIITIKKTLQTEDDRLLVLLSLFGCFSVASH